MLSETHNECCSEVRALRHRYLTSSHNVAQAVIYQKSVPGPHVTAQLYRQWVQGSLESGTPAALWAELHVPPYMSPVSQIFCKRSANLRAKQAQS